MGITDVDELDDLEESGKKGGFFIKGVFSKIGFALFFSTIITAIIQIIFISSNGSSFTKDVFPIIGAISNILIMYPLVYVMLMRMQRKQSKKVDFSKKDLFKFFLIGIFVMYVGTIIGNVTVLILTSGDCANPVVDLFSGENLLLKALFSCVLVPIFEELIFRKLFVDIIAPYGEKAAIIYSAFCFALVHGNIFQIFYAFGLGLLFGYVYVKSKKVINTIVLHICCNFMCGALPMIVMNTNTQKYFDFIELFQSGSNVPKELVREVLPNIITNMLYVIVYISMAIAGLVIFFKNRKNFTLKDSEKRRYLPMFFNVGTILFSVVFGYIIVSSLKG